MWSKASKILKKKVKKGRKKSILLASLVCYSAAKHSHGLFRPISFLDGTLSLKVESQAQAAEVLAQQTQIIEKVNQTVGQAVVKRLRIKID